MSQIARALKHERIRLEMRTVPLSTEESAALGPRATRELKERVLDEIAALLDATAPIGSRKRLFDDLVHRERKASTATGRGLAIPHVRTMNVKEPIVAFLRSTPGLDFAAPDDRPVHVFLVLVAPPWDDRLYLKFYREAADLFLRDGALETLLAARTESDVLAFFRSVPDEGSLER